MMMSNYYLNAMGLVSCLGGDKKAIAKVLFYYLNIRKIKSIFNRGQHNVA